MMLGYNINHLDTTLPIPCDTAGQDTSTDESVISALKPPFHIPLISSPSSTENGQKPSSQLFRHKESTDAAGSKRTMCQHRLVQVPHLSTNRYRYSRYCLGAGTGAVEISLSVESRERPAIQHPKACSLSNNAPSLLWMLNTVLGILQRTNGTAIIIYILGKLDKLSPSWKNNCVA